jgi:hypothetical protein
VRPIGFSTGAVAKGDLSLALYLLRASGSTAIELSALRIHELPTLMHYVNSHSFGDFTSVSVHAPSAFSPSDEKLVVRDLSRLAERGWPVVVHPDAIHQPSSWVALGSMLLIENMDKRKPIGRTAAELRYVFAHLPKASLCLDLAHARQVDSSMTEAYLIIREFAPRIRQLHVSDVTTSSRHARLSPTSLLSYSAIAPMLDRYTPAIIESPVQPSEMRDEMERTRAALNEVTFSHVAG